MKESMRVRKRNSKGLKRIVGKIKESKSKAGKLKEDALLLYSPSLMLSLCDHSFITHTDC